MTFCFLKTLQITVQRRNFSIRKKLKKKNYVITEPLVLTDGIFCSKKKTQKNPSGFNRVEELPTLSRKTKY